MMSMELLGELTPVCFPAPTELGRQGAPCLCSEPPLGYLGAAAGARAALSLFPFQLQQPGVLGSRVCPQLPAGGHRLQFGHRPSPPQAGTQAALPWPQWVLHGLQNLLPAQAGELAALLPRCQSLGNNCLPQGWQDAHVGTARWAKLLGRCC